MADDGNDRGGTARVVSLLLIGAAALGVAAWSYQRNTSPQVAANSPDAPAEVAADATETTSAEGAPDETAETGDTAAASTADPVEADPEAEVATPAPEPEAVTPEFDVVRIEPDGATLVAGRADPGTDIALKLGDEVVATATAEADGNFVAMFTLLPDPGGRLLSMVMTAPDGTETAAAETVAIAPIAPPPEPDTVEAAPEEPVAPAVDATSETASAAETAPDAPAAAQAAEVAEAPAALILSEDGVEVAQGGAASDPVLAANVSLGAISYSPEGAVDLSGTGTAGAAVRIYLDNAPLTDTAIAPDGTWSLRLPDVAPGIYTLRVDQIDAAGVVTSRFETPFKRETLEALAAAQGTAPAPASEAGSEAGETASAAPETEAEAPAGAADDGAVADAAPADDPAAEEDTSLALSTAEAAPAAAPADAAAAPAETEVAAPEAAAEGTAEPVVAPEAEPAPEAAATEPAVAEAPPAPPAPVTVTVQPGFTLWGIAEGMMGEGVMYVQVFDANRDKIRDPDLIYPGQVFTIPTATP